MAARLSVASPFLKRESAGDIPVSLQLRPPFGRFCLLALTSCIESTVYQHFMSREPPLPGSASIPIKISAGSETAIIDIGLLTPIWLARNSTRYATPFILFTTQRRDILACHGCLNVEGVPRLRYSHFQLSPRTPE
ncbi:hypothetical protein LX32DRAFT_213220 [Colletotrichum zoysiae]|uniref:Uncharacterized protein n=1 Tax=Colletotrichum zoysiae TaxID=1216348 RepID=A0AAD9H608_9PEZI|nr:hypothetical protein LX32DRAFT_213220 [Colletotrichum zoysiae]